MKVLLNALLCILGIAQGSQYLRSDHVLPKAHLRANDMQFHRSVLQHLRRENSSRGHLPPVKGKIDIRHLLGAVEFSGDSCVNLPEDPSSEGWNLLDPNDDWYFGPFSLGFEFDLFGTNHNEIYVNNNGNLSFGKGYSKYSPEGFPVNDYPMVAPFWADVDTRSNTGGEVWYKQDGNTFVATWIEVEYYSNGPLYNTFQVIITDGQHEGVGIGKNACFCYGDMQWTTGSASGGVDGFGGYPATVGINKGDGLDYTLLGRFDEPSDVYRGPDPTDPPSGVYWLTDKSFCFDGGEGVIDAEDPEAKCKAHDIFLDSSGDGNMTADDIDDESSDNVAIASLAVNKTSFTCSDVGANIVELTVVDTSGNIDACFATVTVVDDLPPIAVCKDVTKSFNRDYIDYGYSIATISGSELDDGSTDNCGIASMDVTENHLGCGHVGENLVTLTLLDESGNVATCVSTVTVVDDIVRSQSQTLERGPIEIDISHSTIQCAVSNQVPEARCKAHTTSLDSTGMASISLTDVDDNSSDNCDVESILMDKDTFSCVDVGSNVVNLDVTDTSGNLGTCEAEVTVLDDMPPTAVCKNNIILILENGSASITGEIIDGGSSDNCEIVSLDVSQTDFSLQDVGDLEVTLTVTDSSANIDSCNTMVTVVDNSGGFDFAGEGCRDLPLDPSSAGWISLPRSDDGSFGPFSLEFEFNLFGLLFNKLFVNNNGNLSFDQGYGTYTPSGFPVDGNPIVAPFWADVDTRGENGGMLWYKQEGNSFIVTWIMVQHYQFGPLYNSFQVIITDGQQEGIGIGKNTCFCYGEMQWTTGDASGGTDGFGGSPATVGINKGDGVDFALVGRFNEASDIYRGPDPNDLPSGVYWLNDKSFCFDASEGVIDTEDPEAYCKNLEISLDSNGIAQITAEDIDDNSVDNTAIFTLLATPTDFSCEDIGQNEVELTAVDTSGNKDTCFATVSVVDDTPPNAVCKDAIVSLTYDEASGINEGFLSGGDIDGGSSDNCGIASLDVDKEAFSCAHVGANDVHLTVVDSSGNMASCGAMVAVVDDLPPIAACRDITVTLVQQGGAPTDPFEAHISSSDINSLSTDNCEIVSFLVDQTIFTCSDIGSENVVELTVVDVGGNIDTCDARVTVTEDIEPLAVCSPRTVELDSSGIGIVIPSDIDGGSSDNCGLESLAINGNNEFSCYDIGYTDVVELVATDKAGNSASCDAEISVVDVLAPTAVCKDIVVPLTGDTTSISSSDVDDGSTDNCGTVSFILDQTSFFCGSIGENIVTLNVIDSSGNSDTCISKISVVDAMPPHALCQDVTVPLSSNGEASIAPVDIDGGCTDNCEIVSSYVDYSVFTCEDIGDNVVELTVFDAGNNVDSDKATVTVVDSLLPTAVCKDITIPISPEGTASITGSDVDGGCSDNCGVASLDLDRSEFSSADIGNPVTVELAVTDTSGNVAVCNAIVNAVDDSDYPLILNAEISDHDIAKGYLGDPNGFIQITNTVSSDHFCYAVFSNGHVAGTNSETGEFLLPNDGLILSSGNPSDFNSNDSEYTTTKFGTPGDSDLDKLTSGHTFDACFIQFDFSCPPETDTYTPEVNFQYVFGSDEYMDFLNTDFNDVFGFFLNGENIALIPETNLPVNIHNVNAENNPTYFVQNDSDNGVPYPLIEADGFTTKLTAIGYPQRGWNTIKIAISDVNDWFVDSWVLLESATFSCVPHDATPEILSFDHDDIESGLLVNGRNPIGRTYCSADPSSPSKKVDSKGGEIGDCSDSPLNYEQCCKVKSGEGNEVFKCFDDQGDNAKFCKSLSF